MKKTTIILILLAFIAGGCGQSVFFRQHFEEYTHLKFPPSGKIVDIYGDGWTDWYCFGTIEMDTLDYMKILHTIQMRNDSSYHNDNVTYREFTLSDSETEYAYFCAGVSIPSIAEFVIEFVVIKLFFYKSISVTSVFLINIVKSQIAT